MSRGWRQAHLLRISKMVPNVNRLYFPNPLGKHDRLYKTGKLQDRSFKSLEVGGRLLLCSVG